MEGTSGMTVKETGVFYSEVMRNDQAPSDMNIGKAFDALVREGLLEREGVRLFEAKPVEEELVLRVHSREWLGQVKREGLWEVSLCSAGAVVMAFEKVLSVELQNALALVGIGGHHAGRDYAYGGCYVNHEAIAVAWARGMGKGTRFAIVDTDTHHGDGTRELFSGDDDVLHICYCGYGGGDGKTKVCFPHASGDDEFVRRLQAEVPPLIQAFKPELILWFCGLDTHEDSYGTRRLTSDCYPRLCEVLKETAERVCRGRLVVRVGCNAPSRAAAEVLPNIVKVLAGREWR
jgi:acetoin utilization deacetylase AcuC-like enzyme